ncbi:hypothetical protein EI77_00881 [Prosthecobacter fusiformis]|uniref:DUF3592 domain-containing protein n=1 Tax=Prosthecobacter fusiformis TaxID=48464 RepID=A0A4R7SR52_9BACT|nr:DUF3592 domain-containing protein [Prosthecobacter fusiformis]TDU81571.1 hypothetical protein EI77_00881 [Prosthecobacter fusiformis]
MIQKSTQAKIVAVVLVIAGPLIAYQGYQDGQRLDKIEKEGITVDGNINGGESKRSGKRSRSYNFNATFTPQGGSPVTKDFQVTSSFFSSRTSEDSITDPAIQVRYLAADVENSAIIVGGSKDMKINVKIGIGTLVVGLGIFLYFLIRKSSVAG